MAQPEVDVDVLGEGIGNLDLRPDDKFDIFFIHHEDDEKSVDTLMKVLTKFVPLPNGRQLTFHTGLPYIANRFDYFDQCRSNATKTFIYFNNATTETDNWLNFQTHVVLLNMIMRNDNSVIPVVATPLTKLPGVFDIYVPLKVFRLLNKKSIDDITDVSALTESDVDMDGMAKIGAMFP